MVIKVTKEFLMCRNKELLMSEVLKENRQRRLVDVNLENENLFLTFSDECNCEIKTVVKQYSKKKYKDITECIKIFQRNKYYKLFTAGTVWRIIKVIELPNVWLIFFERNFHNN